jgi:hypothetical protein
MPVSPGNRAGIRDRGIRRHHGDAVRRARIWPALVHWQPAMIVKIAPDVTRRQSVE